MFQKTSDRAFTYVVTTGIRDDMAFIWASYRGYIGIVRGLNRAYNRPFVWARYIHMELFLCYSIQILYYIEII